METNLILSLTETFEGHAQQTENGIEYWLARDLQHLLGYTKWDNFLNVVNKARTACEVSGHAIQDHFADVGKMVELGSGIPRITQYYPESAFHFSENFLRMTFPAVEPVYANEKELDTAGKGTARVTAPVEAPVNLTQTEQKIIKALTTQSLGQRELLDVLGYKQKTGNYKNSMAQLMSSSLIEHTLPEKPNSRLQKYRLTEKGRQHVEDSL